VDEEVNQIAFSALAATSHLATADDSGCVTVLELSSGTQTFFSEYLHDEDGLAIATSAVFRPNFTQIASGGTDCYIHLWEVNENSNQAISSLQIAREDFGANQICNPPMVHSLSWSPSGKFLAAGLGDGSCAVLQVTDTQITELKRLQGTSEGGLASVLFPGFGANEQQSDDRLLISAANAGTLDFWDLGSKLVGNNSIDPASLFPTKSNIEEETMDFHPMIIFTICHHSKTNWLESCNEKYSNSSALCVADTTPSITVYPARF